MANIKETLLSTLRNGKEVLADITSTRRNANDITVERGRVDSTINQLHPHRLDLVVQSIEPASKDAKVIRLASANGYLPPFEAGQYINVYVEIDGVLTSRPYSLSSSPRQRAYYEITVQRVKNGFVSNYLLDNLKVGDRLSANSPHGVFHYNPVFHQHKMVMLAGGSGVTPFLSMTREILEAGLDREVVLMYGFRSTELAIAHNEFVEFDKNYKNFTYVPVISEPQQGWKGKTGFLDRKLIKEVVGDTDNCTFYVCGPEVMNEFCLKELHEMGIPAKRIRRELFGTRQDIWNEACWPEGLTGKEVFNLKVGDIVVPAVSGESLLTALERNKLRVNVCCRSGECSLCRVKLVSGKVFTARGALMRFADEKFGYIHSCKTFPVSDVEIIL